MNKSTLLFLLVLTLILTACSGSASNAADPASGTQNGPAAGELSASVQVAIGTLLRRFPGISLDVPAESVSWRPRGGNGGRSLRELPVVLGLPAP